ncbi:hypothetical protein VT84_13650 [Gemmata sp. SH-PL17]|nr:hypothetical protein VT84_13650 [Gemmata sp. SH-PL17]
MSFGQLMVVFDVKVEQELSLDDVKKHINERRMVKGLAPMKKAPKGRR